MNALSISIIVSFTVFFIVFVILRVVNKDKLIILKRARKLVTNNKKEVAEKKKAMFSDRKMDTKVKFLKALSSELSLSGILIRPSEFFFIWILMTLVPSCIILVLSQDIIVGLGVLLIGLFLPPFFVHRKKVKRIELFEKQLVDAIAIICNSLRSGLNFQQALESISKEMPEPISKEFGRAIREMRLGNNMEKALNNMSERLNSKDFTLIVSAVLIQRQIGGNLSEILSNLAGTISERYKIKSEIKVLTTTGRSSGMVVGFLPIGILLLFMLISPNYVKSFFNTTLGIIFLSIAAVLETIGFLVIKKIVNIKY